MSIIKKGSVLWLAFTFSYLLAASVQSSASAAEMSHVAAMPLLVSEAEPLSDCVCTPEKEQQCRGKGAAWRCCATDFRPQGSCKIYCGTACAAY